MKFNNMGLVAHAMTASTVSLNRLLKPILIFFIVIPIGLVAMANIPPMLRPASEN